MQLLPPDAGTSKYSAHAASSKLQLSCPDCSIEKCEQKSAIAIPHHLVEKLQRYAMKFVLFRTILVGTLDIAAGEEFHGPVINYQHGFWTEQVYDIDPRLILSHCPQLVTLPLLNRSLCFFIEVQRLVSFFFGSKRPCLAPLGQSLSRPRRWTDTVHTAPRVGDHNLV